VRHQRPHARFVERDHVIETLAPRRPHKSLDERMGVSSRLHRVRTVMHRAAQFVRPDGAMRLRLTDNPATRHTFTRIRDALAKVA
jgi:hypothetical protein